MIIIVEESRFEIVPPRRQPFVVLRKRRAAGMIIIVEELQFETVPSGDDCFSCYASGVR